MKSAEEIMEILEAFDLTGSYRAAGELAGCSHHTVGHWVAARDAGELRLGAPVRRERLVDGFLPKLEELVDRSKGRIRADVAHRKITAMGFAGSERTTRRAVAEIKRAYRAGRRRVEEATPMVSFDGGRYSVPHRLAGDTVWLRRHGEQIVIVHCGADGPVEVARHRATTPGSPQVADEHFPPAPAGPLHRTPRARTTGEQAFLAIGDGAALWLAEAAAAGASRIRAKMAEAVQLARLHPPAAVDRALGQAATAGRFAETDLTAILTHQAQARTGPITRAGEDHTLAQGTAGWAGFGTGEAGR